MYGEGEPLGTPPLEVTGQQVSLRLEDGRRAVGWRTAWVHRAWPTDGDTYVVGWMDGVR